MMILVSVMFMMMTQPMSLVMVMVLMVFVYSLYMYYGSGTFLYGLILMLVMLSGVMVVFSYMASMSPNDKFEVVVSGMIMVILMSSSYLDLWRIDFTFFSMELWNVLIMLINEFIVVFLLVVMLMVIWLSGWWYGPVRV